MKMSRTAVLVAVLLVALAVAAVAAVVWWLRRRDAFDSPAPTTAAPTTAAPTTAAPTTAAPAAKAPTTAAPAAKAPATKAPATKDTSVGADYSRTNAGLKPKSLQMFGREHLYQIPPNAKGTVAMFPGCVRSAYGFWPAGTCKGCLGMPEDVANAKQALRRGYAFIALSPKDTKDFCWSGKVDFPDAGAVLERFLSTNGLVRKPLITMGASSGGQIALNMQAHAEANRLPFRVTGVVQLVATRIPPRPMKAQPPVAWVIMSEPRELAGANAMAAKVRKAGAATGVVVAARKKVTPAFFSDRMPMVTPADSEKMVAELVKSKLIDSSGTFLRNPKEPRTWLASMSKALPELFKRQGVSSNFWKSGVAQALLTGYSKHEAVSEYTTAALEWLEGGGKANFAQMAEKYRVPAIAALTI
jgi:hypothetical protein